MVVCGSLRGVGLMFAFRGMAVVLVAAGAGLAAPALSQTSGQGNPTANQTASQTAYQTLAPNALLLDFDTGSVLFEKSADQPVVPASTVKLMTAEFVFRELAAGRLHLEDEFAVSENAWRTGGAISRGSSMFAALNSHIKVADLLRGLLIVSGNDAAIVLAEGIAGNEAAFATRMNQRAAELGLKSLRFSNSWGKDDADQRVSARDMATLAAHIIRTYPEYYGIFSEKELLWNRIRQPNRNPLLPMNIGADGLKTGNITEASGFAIVGSAVQNGQRLILAMYGLRTAKDRSEEARKFFLWGFRSFESRTVVNKGAVVGSARLYGGAQMSVDLAPAADVRIFAPRGGSERLSARIVYDSPVLAPVQEAQVIGHLNVYRGNVIAVSAPLQAVASVEVGSLYRRALDAGLELTASLWRKFVVRK